MISEDSSDVFVFKVINIGEILEHDQCILRGATRGAPVQDLAYGGLRGRIDNDCFTRSVWMFALALRRSRAGHTVWQLSSGHRGTEISHKTFENSVVIPCRFPLQALRFNCIGRTFKNGQHRSTDLGRLANIVSLRKGEEQARAVMLEIFGQDATAPLLQRAACRFGRLERPK
jgi:hypothetical protein